LIRAEKLTIRNGGFRLDEISFEVPTGGYAVLMGRTGSGKTTLVEAICGLKKIESGTLLIGGVVATRLKPALRGVGWVPQDGALFTSMTVSEHLAFAPYIHGWDRNETANRVEELAALLQISHLLQRHPHGLSGGERQRVALGRALACRPPVLLLDEPLSALDDDTRTDMLDLLKTVQRETGVTVLHVTHNRTEAEQLASMRLTLTKGQLTGDAV